MHNTESEMKHDIVSIYQPFAKDRLKFRIVPMSMNIYESMIYI